MTTALLLLVVAVAVLACPLHMLWNARRGRKPGCVIRGCGGDSVEERQDRLAARVQALVDERAPHLR